METEKKVYARYYIVRELKTMWRGDAAETGSLFREFVITSNQFTSTLGTFQVYGLEGASGGIKDGKFSPSDAEPTLLFDEDFNGLDAAAKQFEHLVKEGGRRDSNRSRRWRCSNSKINYEVRASPRSSIITMAYTDAQSTREAYRRGFSRSDANTACGRSYLFLICSTS